ncbi:MAG: hypothetical protein NWF11_01645 [Candidatus Bathyarchaeota archaeon]|nr:hypothetical protein [Candidatus Bathyarchaeota archaeon]
MFRKVLFAICLSIVSPCFLSSNIGIAGVQTNLIIVDELPRNMPAIYVDPPDITGVGPGETFTASIKVFNLTTSFWQTTESWERGEELGPWTTYPPYNYSLGNLIGLEFQLGWDDTVLKFVSNTTKIPANQYADGVLYSPILKLRDNVTETSFPYPQPEESKYWLAYATLDVTKPFNGNGTVVELTFEVLKEGATYLNITSSRLADHRGEPIPHKFLSGIFRSPDARTRLAEVDVGAVVYGQYFEPALVGEDVGVSVQVRNDGEVVDIYNLTLSHDGQPLQSGVWIDQVLDPGTSNYFTYTFSGADLTMGMHNISFDLAVLHEGTLVGDFDVQQFRVIDTPHLEINGPTSAKVGETISYNAFNSSHRDPDGAILDYTWALTCVGEDLPRMTQQGESVAFHTSSYLTGGNYSVSLEVRDNFGVEYHKARPATTPYREEYALVLISIPTPIRISYVSPSTGIPGQSIYITGERASSNGEVEIYFEDTSIGSTQADDSGKWRAYLTVPMIPTGLYTIRVVDIISNMADTTFFTVLQSPILHVEPSEASIGSKITVFGEGFQPNAGIYIAFEDLMFFSIIYIGEDGTFNTTVTVPIVNSGEYTIKIIGTYSMYPGGWQAAVETIFTVTEGLDTLFQELLALEEALDQLRSNWNCSCNTYNYTYNYNYNCNCNCSCADRVDEECTYGCPEEEPEANVTTESTLDEAGSDGLSSDEIADLAGALLFEARALALVAILGAVTACMLTALVLSRRR